MIFTSSILKGYQVLAGWFQLELAMAIAMLITTKVPSQELFKVQIYNEETYELPYDETVLPQVNMIYNLQCAAHFIVALLTFVQVYSFASRIIEVVVELGMMCMLWIKIYLLI
jgi:hypothetical protein